MVIARNQPLLQYISENRAVVSAVRNPIAMWLLGYISCYGPVPQIELDESLELSNAGELHRIVQELVEGGLVEYRKDGLFEVSRNGAQLGRMLGITPESMTGYEKSSISCDVFQIQNVKIKEAKENSRTELVDQLVYKPRLYGEREGYHFGFVECKTIKDEIVYGYFTQEYWDHSLKYDDGLERQEQWDTRNMNILFVWPLRSQVIILQDTRFFGSSLSMTTAKNRIVMLLSLLLDHCKFERTGDVLLSPFERTMSQEEMLEVLAREDVVSKVDIGLETQEPLQGAFPVFNPREDWNEMLRQIINDYEIPNLASVVFKAKRIGTLSRSKITKALAMAGQLKNLDLGRGKNKRTVTKKIPIHVGQVNVSEPAQEDEILGVLGFLQDRVGISFTDLPINTITKDSQMRLQI
ncbi:MAG: MarR family transcriptional regulator [Chloroflexi bacterium]|nr:MarR family transcriptional regulator [Chloroflexota bacterium]